MEDLKLGAVFLLPCNNEKVLLGTKTLSSFRKEKKRQTFTCVRVCVRVCEGVVSTLLRASVESLISERRLRKNPQLFSWGLGRPGTPSLPRPSGCPAVCQAPSAGLTLAGTNGFKVGLMAQNLQTHGPPP